MSDWSCVQVRERLPDHARGRSAAGGAVARHLETCAECAAEADLLAALLASRPEPPEALADRVRAAIAHDRAAGRPRDVGVRRRWLGVPRWSLAAAAALVLALGTGLFWHGPTTGPADGPLARVALNPVPETLMDDDAVIAGAPVLDDLEEDVLLALLEEMR